METTSSFGYWIRRQRKTLDLTQQALADKVGCSVAAIKKIEGEERRSSRQIVERLADIPGVPTDQREIFWRLRMVDFVRATEWQSLPTPLKHIRQASLRSGPPSPGTCESG